MTYKFYKCPHCNEHIIVWGYPQDSVETEFVIQRADHINQHAKEIIKKHKDKLMMSLVFNKVVGL